MTLIAIEGRLSPRGQVGEGTVGNRSSQTREGRVSFDDLSGRQLDLAIARHVFGHQVEERLNSRTGELDTVYNAGMEADAPIWVRVPSYSISLDASSWLSLSSRRRAGSGRKCGQTRIGTSLVECA